MNIRQQSKNITLIGVMVATLEVAKFALSFLPNVELVTLLIMLYTLYFGRKIIYVIPVFVLIEGIVWGFGIWWIMYLYVWPLLALITYLFRKTENVVFWAVIAGVFGLTFGALGAIPYLFVGGWGAAISWWVAGIPYDIIHCMSNIVITLVLFPPLRKALSKRLN